MASLWSYWRRGGEPVQKFDTVGGGLTYAMELTKRRPVVSLTGQGADTGTLRIELSWRMHGTDIGSRRESVWRHPWKLFKPPEIQNHTQGLANVDIDLACMYELADGTKGVVQPLGAIMPLAEAQSEWVADLLEGKVGLPPEHEMDEVIRREDDRMRKRYVASPRHTIQVDFFPYLRTLHRERRSGRGGRGPLAGQRAERSHELRLETPA